MQPAFNEKSTFAVEITEEKEDRSPMRGKKCHFVVDTSGIEPDTFRKFTEVRSERDKPTTPCAPSMLGILM